MINSYFLIDKFCQFLGKCVFSDIKVTVHFFFCYSFTKLSLSAYHIPSSNLKTGGKIENKYTEIPACMKLNFYNHKETNKPHQKIKGTAKLLDH